MLDKIVRLLFGRFQVRHRKSVPWAIEILRDRLKENGFAHTERITDQVAVIIIHEAARRAVETECDGALRTGSFLDQVEAAADSIVKVAAGDANADPRMRSILEFHKIV